MYICITSVVEWLSYLFAYCVLLRLSHQHSRITCKNLHFPKRYKLPGLSMMHVDTNIYQYFKNNDQKPYHCVNLMDVKVIFLP